MKPSPATHVTGALIYWFDISPSMVDPWLDWYLRDHMPSRVGSTFTTGRCFEAIDGPASHMVLFETHTPEALLAPDYLKLLGTVSDEDRQRRGWYANTVRMTARVQTRVRAGMGSILAVTRFDPTTADDSAARDALDGLPVAAIAALAGVGSIWLADHDAKIRARMDAARVTGHQDRSPQHAIFIEAARDSDALQAQAMVAEHLRAHSPRTVDAVAMGRYRLLYAMAA
ncbi:MAG: hypothetical protein KGR68_08915 [Betaproteobacteria bacterium]|nr:hypothetical protein [Betaproteobacteria bacterium]